MNREDIAKRVMETIPRGSVGRYDLIPIFGDARLSDDIAEYLALPYIGRVDYVAAPEATGWLLGVLLAGKLGVGLIAIRKAGRLPYGKEAVLRRSYIDYTGVEKGLEIRRGSVAPGSRILLADEWVETGAAVRCGIGLLEECGCAVSGLATIGIDYREATAQWIDSGFIRFIGRDM